MVLISTLVVALAGAAAAWIPGDRHPQSPAQGGRGSKAICYESLSLTNTNVVDIFTTASTGNFTMYNRVIPVMIWLPLPSGTSPTGVAQPIDQKASYSFPTPGDLVTGNPKMVYPGVAKPGCSALATTKLATKAPLVILSHGFPGKKEFWSGHAEALASKGYAVVAIDHTDSVWSAANLSSIGTPSFISALLNRRQDQLFVYDQIANLSTAPTQNAYSFSATTTSTAYLVNNVDTTKTTVWGYSFGGYGSLLTAGATINPNWFTAAGLGSLLPLFAPLQTPSKRPGIKAVVSIAPWGNGVGFLGGSQAINVTSLAGVTIPVMVIGGEFDDVAGYDGIKGLFNGLTNSPGKAFVTLRAASHNIALNPPPANWLDVVDSGTWQRLAEAQWDHRFLLNVVQHLGFTFTDFIIKGNTGANPGLVVTPASGPDATGTTTPRSIPGFSFRTADAVSIDH